MNKFSDRHDAGRVLASLLTAYANHSDAIVLALPRGGVPVAYEIANALALPLDIFVVRKLGVPGHEELAFGAIASGDVIVFNSEIVNDLKIPKSAIDQVIKAEQKELQRRDVAYRGTQPFPVLKDKIIILVDDGMATGATMRAAIEATRKQQPRYLIVAVPVAADSTCQEMAPLVDEFICPLRPHDFYAVGVWYDEFLQTTDEEVHQLLQASNQ